MRALYTAAALLVAAPSYAQSRDVYASLSGGFAVSPDGTSADLLGEVGVRIAPHLSVFGDIGQFHNLQPSQAQPGVEVPIVPHFVANAGYRVSHVSADMPVSAQSVRFGVG
jgi:hypothetical protein